MFEIPGSPIESVLYTEEAILGQCSPEYQYKDITRTNNTTDEIHYQVGSAQS